MLLRFVVTISLAHVLFSAAVYASEPSSPGDPANEVSATSAEDPVLDAQALAAERLYAAQPTGDALWDKYVDAMLEQWTDSMFDAAILHYPSEEPASKPAAEPENPPRLPDEVLATWEPKFGRDPRYWQLRYWNAWQYNDQLEQADTDPDRFLLEGKAKGVTDAATDWLLLKAELKELVQADTAAELEANYQQRLKLLDAFIATYPDESIGWYERALLLADFGGFENCLADLEAGNKAKFNRELPIFPYSFVLERITTGKPVGSEPVAGVVVQAASMWPTLFRPVQVNQFFRGAQVVLAISGNEGILQPLYGYAVRLTLRENATETLPATGVIAIQEMVDYLLLDGYRYLGRQEKEALLRMRNEASWTLGRLAGFDAYGQSKARLDFQTEFYPRHLGREMMSLGLSYDELAAALLSPPHVLSMQPELIYQSTDWYELSTASPWLPWQASWAKTVVPLVSYKVIYDWAVERRGPNTNEWRNAAQSLSQFDMTTLSWPETDADAGA
jgi:hypothetical protein